MLKPLLLATAIAFAIPAGAVMAQDWDDWSSAQEDHGDFHDEIDEAHARAHERGFASPEEHAAYHRALRDLHREYHEDHPDADNDIRLPSRHHPRWYSGYYGYGYYPYGGYYSRPYYRRYYRPYYGSSWSFSFGSGW